MSDFMMISAIISVLAIISSCIAIYLVVLKVNTSKLSKVELDNFCLAVDKKVKEGYELIEKNVKQVDEINSKVKDVESSIEKTQEHYRSIRATVANISRQLKNEENDSVNDDTEVISASDLQQKQQPNFLPSAAILARAMRRGR